MKTSFWKTKCSDLTVGQSVKFGLVAGVLACVPYAVVAAIECQDEIKDWWNGHFGKAQREVASTSEEDEEDWGT